MPGMGDVPDGEKPIPDRQDRLMRFIVRLCVFPALALCLAACGGDDAGGLPGPDGSVTVHLDTFQVIADQTPDPTVFTITLDGEIGGRSLSGTVDYLISIDGAPVADGALAVEGTVAGSTSLREATITVSVPSDLDPGDHSLRGELDPARRIEDQIDHQLWAVRTETFTITDNNIRESGSRFERHDLDVERSG